jgi:hypothetical protein
MRTTRSTAALSGLLIALLGLWGGLIAFVGPYFDYAFGTDESWHYTTDRLWLNILPGALAVLAGVALLLSVRRAALLGGALLALIAGAWFVVGPAVSLTWESGTGPIGRPLFGSTRQMLELVGYFYGLGAVICALAAFSLGRVWTLAAGIKRAEQRMPASAVVSEREVFRQPAVGAAPPPAAQEPVAAEHAGGQPTSRRPGFLRRRGQSAPRQRQGSEAAPQR